MRKLTKAQAGSLGGITTYRKYGSDHMRQIGRKGAVLMHAKYELRPVGTSDFILVNRETGSWSGKTISGMYIPQGRDYNMTPTQFLGEQV